MDAWNPIMEIDPQVEQAVKELEEEVKEEMQYYADLPEMLREQAS